MLYMLLLGEIICKQGIYFHCYADDQRLFRSTKFNNADTISKIDDCVNLKIDIVPFFYLNDKTDVLIVGRLQEKLSLSCF